MPSLLQTSCHSVFDVSTDFGYLSVSCMWHFWQFICLVTLTGSAAVLEHGDFLPFCRGGAYSDLQIIVLALAILNSTHIARRSLWWPRLILSFSELDALRYKFNNFLLDFLGSTFTILCGKPGPKSGWCQLPVPKLLVRLLLLIVLFGADIRGEGCGRPMASTEVPLPQWATDFIRDGTKQHGTRPALRLAHLSWSPTDSFVKKRSMKRAYARACRDGVCWYKGRPYTPTDFPQTLQLKDNSTVLSKQLKPSGRCDLQRYNQRHSSRRRIQILSWNVGGLSQARLDEVRLWALEQQIGITALLETRWPWVSEWEDEKFLYVHSGKPGDRSCGILIMIAKWLCPSSNLRWIESVPGRLVHMQLRIQPRPLDFVACYQFCFAPTHARLQERKRWWDQFSALVGNIPNRHVLTIAGDFNCSLPAAPPHTGPAEFHWGHGRSVGTQHRDHDVFLNLVRTLNLNALNSWDPKLGPTYIKDQTCSRLDYILVRQHMADGVARAVRYIWQAPFVTAFRDHCPMICQINRYWIPAPLTSAVKGCTMQQRAAGRSAFLEDSQLWQTYMQTSREQLQRLIPQLDPHRDDMFSDLNHVLLTAFHDTFPTKSKPSPAVWMASQSWITSKWTHRKMQHALMDCMKQGQLHMKTVFQFWYHVTRFKVMTKSHRRHALLVRKHRFQEVIQSAQTAAERHNIFQLFHLINSFAPKNPKRRMQLRTIQGSLATPVEEHAILCHFVQEVWSGDPLTDAHPHVIPGTPFTEADVQQVLESIPLTKAVAPGFAPGVLWRSHASSLASWLYGILQCWWFSPQPYIPPSWKNAWLCWLPKPGKPPTSPSALRPMALQDPVGKAMIGLISRLGQQGSLDSMICWPLWAYLPHRSTQDSLLRVTQHCLAAKNLVISKRSSPHTRARQMPRTKLCGAVQLLIDMSRAFDTVDRNRLFHKLHTLGVRPEIVKILTYWHQDTCYIVQTNTMTTDVPVARGVRQGCRAAPWLWNCIMTLLLQDLSVYIDPIWLRRCFNLYADDLQTRDLFHDEQELMQILNSCATILAMLSSYGFQINAAKSQILITMTGSSSSRVRQQLFVRQNGTDMLQIENEQHSFCIPIATSAKYLGAVISYTNFADCTVQHRIRLAEIAFYRLRKWLTGKHGLALTDKMRLWHTCIKPIAHYGIFCTGLTTKGIQLLNTMTTKMLRRILHDHAFYTHHTNQQAFEHHGLDSPTLMLWRSADCLYKSVTQRCLTLRAHDMVHTLDWSCLLDVQALLMEHQWTGSQQSPLPLITIDKDFRCQWCDFATSQITTLRKHLAIHHKQHFYRTQTVNPADHMLHGLPQCKHCHQIFTTWRSHLIHVERGCQALQHRDLSSTMPLLPTSLTNARADAAMRGQTQLGPGDLRNIIAQEWGHRLLTLIGYRRFHQLIHEDAINDYLSQRCCLCAQRVGRAQEMHRHLRLFHAPYWPMVMAKSTQLSNLYAEDSPCRFCRCIFKTSHSCNTWTQVSLLLIYGAGRLTDSNVPCSPAMQCEICDQHMDSAEQLHLHLVNDHNLASARWNPSRDSIDGGSGCAHCGTIFSSLESLRSHIAQGRCRSFDPSLSCEPKQITELVKQALTQGGLTEALQNSHWRMQMTLHCQNCSHTCTRAGDLMLHLRSCHPKLWQDSIQLTSILIGMYYTAWGCLCNPTTAAKRLNHVCVPLKQLAMQFYRLPPSSVFCPLLVTEQMLAKAYHQNLPRELKFAIDRTMIMRDFQFLLRQQDMMRLLTCTCILCANTFTPTDLGLHLREVHDCSTTLISFFVQQLHPAMLESNSMGHACVHCGMIFDIPLHLQIGDGNDQSALFDRVILAQNHYKAHCPGTLQLAIVLCRIYNDGRHRHDGQYGCLTAGSGGIPTTGSPDGCEDGSRSQPAAQSQSAETSQKRRRTGKKDGQAGGGN